MICCCVRINLSVCYFFLFLMCFSCMCDMQIIDIDAKKQVVTCSDGSSFAYDRLINTMPLDHLCRITKGLGFAVCCVSCVHVGVGMGVGETGCMSESD